MSFPNSKDIYLTITSFLPFQEHGILPTVSKKWEAYENDDALWKSELEKRGLEAELKKSRSTLVSHLRRHCSLFFKIRNIAIQSSEKANVFALYEKIILDADYTQLVNLEFHGLQQKPYWTKERQDFIVRSFLEQDPTIRDQGLVFWTNFKAASNSLFRILIQREVRFSSDDLTEAFYNGRPDDVLCKMIDTLIEDKDTVKRHEGSPLVYIRNREDDIPVKAVSKMIEKFPVTKGILYDAIKQKYPEFLVAAMAEKASNDTSWPKADPIEWLLNNSYSEKLIGEFLKYEKEIRSDHLKTALEKSFSPNTLQGMLDHIQCIDYRTLEIAANNANRTRGYLLKDNCQLNQTVLPDDLLIAMIDKCGNIKELKFDEVIGRVSSTVLKHFLVKGSTTCSYDVCELMRWETDEELVLYFIEHFVGEKGVHDNYLDIAKNKKYSKAVIQALKKKHYGSCTIS